MSTIPYPKTHKRARRDEAASAPTTRRRRSLGRHLVTGAGWLLLDLLLLMTALPVLLLFLTTAVPRVWSLALVAVLGGLVVVLFRFERSALLVTGVIVGAIATSVVAVWLSQVYATTPPITDARGNVVPGSIATLEQVELNGSRQWVSIRGHDVDNPVLLFLAGGPGGSQLTTARHALAELEQHFVVVNWEQPGAGKSYNAVDRATLTPERYVSDGHALVLYLRERFGVEKVYVLGESWGSALGIMLVQRYPELFHAHVGTAQMVDFLETDRVDYEFALEWAKERGDTRKVAQLEAQGPPPYYGDDVAWQQVNYLKDTYAYMNQDPNVITNFNTPRDLASPEYGLLDKVNWARGPLTTLGVVYQQLWDVDFRTQ
ncbi:MAG: alpha/beta fold hydrolase, partial [Caldilineaceae bacterium]|nr:alpha/beta fold hydrolase [Caldilineaceae bacterium]